MNETTRKDGGKDGSADDLLGAMCHDLRDPLSAIVMGTTYLMKELGDGGSVRARKMVEAIHRSAERLSRRLGDYQTLARLQRSLVTSELEAHGAKGLLEDARLEAAAAAETAGVKVTIETRDPSMMVACDRAQVLEVLAKLLSNAVRASPRGGEVTLAVEGEANDARIRVIDEGPGIDPEIARHLDDVAWLASRRAREGTGLGLAIARGLVEAQGGALDVRSTIKGTIATFTLPRAALA